MSTNKDAAGAKNLAPTGTLRAAINLGNTVLAQTGPDGKLQGITADLAGELARRLGVPLELVPFSSAGKVFEALKSDAWDVAFLAIEPVRAAEIAFTAPYVLIEGAYLVPKDSKLKTIDDVDHTGVRIGVGGGSAYDLYLTRTLKHATLVRDLKGGAASIEVFRREGLEVAAGVRQPLVAYAKDNADVYVMDGKFMEIRQAMGTPRTRPGSEESQAYLSAFVEEMKASGFVADGLKRSQQHDAVVAPPG